MENHTLLLLESLIIEIAPRARRLLLRILQIHLSLVTTGNTSAAAWGVVSTKEDVFHHHVYDKTHGGDEDSTPENSLQSRL
ncbi:hypothetical protein M3A49_29280 [Paraburkholderia sp. CNPSo 3076]|uniref:hypothetical protein n=1 Tax=Paraburkholderia sp. CNPSo 3076 TaxID=2940936 RepID=UPI002257880F|nr:hypothetical protein [Paraburkholderia sp. CNPSo 3076]MCX5543532.1 hypothetical protein [Paraburkholderia sp. CNPSo 3076]